jgi:PAS domain-containing protein
MMVILSKSRLIAFAVVVCLILAALGWHGYNLVTSLGDSGIETRLAAEEILFASIAAILIVVILAVILLRRAASLDKRLDRLIEQGRNSEIVPGRDFSTMGPLGDKLRDLFNLLSQSNYQKTRKISAMQALVIFLIRNQDQAIVICDSAGIVRYVSDVFLEKRQLTRVDVLDFSLSEALPGIPLDQIASQLTRSREPLEGKTDDTAYACYPFTDRSNELSYLVFLFDAKAGYFEKRSNGNEVENSRRRRSPLLSGLERWISERGFRARRDGR